MVLGSNPGFSNRASATSQVKIHCQQKDPGLLHHVYKTSHCFQFSSGEAFSPGTCDLWLETRLATPTPLPSPPCPWRLSFSPFRQSACWGGGGIPTGESWRAVDRRWPPLMAERGNLKIGKDGECKHWLKTELGKIFERTRTEKFFNQLECWEEAHF